MLKAADVASVDAATFNGAPVPVELMDRDGLFAGGRLAQAGSKIAVSRPTSADEVGAMVKWARSKRIAMGTLSSAHGSPRRAERAGKENLIMDLGQMSRIFHIDPSDGVAIIEPGVSFAALDTALAPKGLRSFKPLLPRSGKSVIASYLEREPLLVPREHWDVLDPFGSAEIVFGSGERFYTGAASNPGTMKEHWKAGLRYMTATGPVGTDFMRVLQGSQGTLGVVTWAAIFCDRLPKAEQSFLIGSDTLEPLLSLSAELTYRRLGHALFLSNARQLEVLAAATGSRVDATALPNWALFVNFAAASDLPEERVAFEVEDTTALAAEAGLAPVSELAGLPAQTIIDSHAALQGTDYRNALKGDHQSVFFLTQVDRTPGFVTQAKELAAKHDYASEDCAIYIQPRLQGRNCSIEFVLPFESLPSAETERAEAFATELAKACCDNGGFFSRPYGEWTPMAYAKNPEIVPFLKHCKSMFDPDGILQPGRLGF